MKRVEIDDDSRLRAMHDDDCDLRIFLGGRVAVSLTTFPGWEHRYGGGEEEEGYNPLTPKTEAGSGKRRGVGMVVVLPL